MRRVLYLAALLILGIAPAYAQSAARTPELSPGTTYDPKIPSLKAVLGYDHGERITPPSPATRLRDPAAPAYRTVSRTIFVKSSRATRVRPVSGPVHRSAATLIKIGAVA
jgi:hypothetical protein